MTTFNEREKGYEAKYAHDQETKFKIAARRNKLLGQWAAAQMGITGAKADDYAKEVVAADLAESGDEDVFRKVFGDLKTKGVDISEHRVRRQMEELYAEAVKQITGK